MAVFKKLDALLKEANETVTGKAVIRGITVAVYTLLPAILFLYMNGMLTVEALVPIVMSAFFGSSLEKGKRVVKNQP